MEKQKRILLIEFCNYEDYPIGGLLTFSKNLIVSFKSQLALVGITTRKSDPVGRWFKKKINGIEYDFFALSRYDKSKTKNLIPDRLSSYFLLKYFKQKILTINIDNVFIQRQDILLAVKKFRFQNICFCFAGLENPLKFSKYWYAHYIANYFDKLTFSGLKRVNTILAAGDQNAISEMVIRSKHKLKEKDIIKFPTRISTDIFKPYNKTETRKNLNISDSLIMISTTGRLSSGKGWKFMIDCFAEFEKKNSNSLLYFIGEGEDAEKIKEYISFKDLTPKIKLVGKKTPEEVALFLNASDLYIMGSYKEGWSTTLLEALACGVPICTTNFSSAKEIITQSVSGYVIEDHDIPAFTAGMENTLLLDRTILPIHSEIIKYSIGKLKQDLLNHWKLY